MLRFFIICFCLTIGAFINAATPNNLPAGSSVPKRQVNPNNTDGLLQRTLRYAQGNREFRNIDFKEHEAEFLELVNKGQFPTTLFIGCSDSRVMPDLLLRSRPGELFVIRNAGNFVPVYNPNIAEGVGATIQYAVEALNVKDIIVCGHSHCGAIKGLFQDLNPNQLGLVIKWIQQWGQEAKQATLTVVPPSTSKEELFNVAEHMSVLYQLRHLLSYPFIQQRVAQNRLHLHGWYYDIATGHIEYYDQEKNDFLLLDDLLKLQASPRSEQNERSSIGPRTQ